MFYNPSSLKDKISNVCYKCRQVFFAIFSTSVYIFISFACHFVGSSWWFIFYIDLLMVYSLIEYALCIVSVEWLKNSRGLWHFLSDYKYSKNFTGSTKWFLYISVRHYAPVKFKIWKALIQTKQTLFFWKKNIIEFEFL